MWSIADFERIKDEWGDRDDAEMRRLITHVVGESGQRQPDAGVARPGLPDGGQPEERRALLAGWSLSEPLAAPLRWMLEDDTDGEDGRDGAVGEDGKEDPADPGGWTGHEIDQRVRRATYPVGRERIRFFDVATGEAEARPTTDPSSSWPAPSSTTSHRRPAGCAGRSTPPGPADTATTVAAGRWCPTGRRTPPARAPSRRRTTFAWRTSTLGACEIGADRGRG